MTEQPQSEVEKIINKERKEVELIEASRPVIDLRKEQPQEQWGIQRGLESALIWKIEKPLEVYTFPLSALDYIESRARAEFFGEIQRSRSGRSHEMTLQDVADVYSKMQSGGKVQR